MSKKPWHPFKAREKYEMSDVVGWCMTHIMSGEVKDKDGKWELLDQFLNCGQFFIVYAPRNAKGWGNSPMNPNNWKTVKGHPLELNLRNE